MSFEFIHKMLNSISSDWYIFVFACIAVVFYVLQVGESRKADTRIREWKTQGKDVKFAEDIHTRLNTYHTIFIAIVSIFPLLGMFGTVIALLNLNIGNGMTDSIKGNFFSALTSTAWGIVFSVVFKVFDSFVSSKIEYNIDEAKRLSEQTYKMPTEQGKDK